jgi:hypothetical protein
MTENDYSKMGRAAMLPGMVHMLELMQQEVDRFRALIVEGSKNELPKKTGSHKKRQRKQWLSDMQAGRAAKNKKPDSAKHTAAQARWARMSKRQRAIQLNKMARGRWPRNKVNGQGTVTEVTQ